MNKFLLTLVFVILIFGISGIIIAEEFKEGIKLSEGKNIINLSFEFSPLYVKDLVLIYPEISTVTYNESNQEWGYVNVFGGIGENFVIYPNKTYEITVKQEVNLNLK
jgi:hypothetical protein